MKLHCREVQQMLPDFQARTMSGDISPEIEAHLKSCVHCRRAAYRDGLDTLLQTAARIPAEDPPDACLGRIRAALVTVPMPRPPASLIELLAPSGLRLAPALAALVMMFSIGAAYIAAPHSSATAAVPAEELLLDDDHPLSPDLMLAALTGKIIEER